MQQCLLSRKFDDDTMKYSRTNAARVLSAWSAGVRAKEPTRRRPRRMDGGSTGLTLTALIMRAVEQGVLAGEPF